MIISKLICPWVVALGLIGTGVAATQSAEPATSARDAPALRILFTRQFNNQDNLYVMSLAGGETKQLTDHRAKDSHGVVSPDGKRIAFCSERVGWWKIWTMNADGSEAKQFTSPEADADYHPAWSPDGKHIVYVSGSAGNGDIMIAAADGSTTVNLTDHPARDNFPAWSPDGSKIAFASDRGEGWGIYLIDPDGKNLRRITGDGQAIEPAWFPGSDRIVFQSDALGSFDLYVIDIGMDAQDSKPRRLTDRASDEKRPAVSPDGRRIAFESNRDGRSDIFVIRADGSGERRLTFEGYNFGPAWFPLPR